MPQTPNSVAPTALRAQRRLMAVRPGQMEAVNDDLYDSVTYALAGTTTSYTFFQSLASKTLADTNMTLNSQLPAGLTFEVRAIELHVFPSINPSAAATVPTTTAGVNAFINDIYTLSRNGYLQFNILAKPYLVQAPIGRFPPSQRLEVAAALSDTTTAGATQARSIGYASFGGATFKITPVLLTSNLNFNVQLVFPTTAAISADAKIFCVLRGIKNRLSQ